MAQKRKMGRKQAPFWQTKTLAQMTHEEWEALCDGCGRCCVQKLEDAETGEVYYTNIACRLLDIQSCRCTAYAQRSQLVPQCLVLTPAQQQRFHLLPETCAYRLLAEGKELAWWHPLVSGNPHTVHVAGISVRGKVVPEQQVPAARWEEHLVSWQSDGGMIFL